MIASLLPLVVLGLIAWAVARALQQHEPGRDRASAARRVFVHGLLLGTLVASASGLVLALEAATGSAPPGLEDRNGDLALGVALLVVTGPAYVLLLRYSRRRLVDSESERRSPTWTAYLDLVLLISTISSVVALQRLLEGIVGLEDLTLKSAMPVAVWGTVWGSHWFWLRVAHPPLGDAHLAAGSVIGLVTLAIGAGGVLWSLGDEIYQGLVVRVPPGHEDTEPGRWLITLAIGGAVWWWHWLKRYRVADRTDLWHVHVVIVGALGGLVTAIASGSVIAYRVLVWFLGDARSVPPGEHFEYVSPAAAALVVGVAVWTHHRMVLRVSDRVVRTEPLRAHDHLMAAAGLVTVVIGATIALVVTVEQVTGRGGRPGPGVANRLLLALTLAAIGGVVWGRFWGRIRRLAAQSPGDELGSPVRRLHLVGVFGVGGVIAIVSLVSLLYTVFEDVLDNTFDSATIRSVKVPLALVLSVSGAAWYHLLVFRSDRAALAALAGITPRPQPATERRRVLLVEPPGGDLDSRLSAVPGIEVEVRHRSDLVEMPGVDVDALVGAIAALDAADLLVVVDTDGPSVVPLTPSPRRPATG